LFQKPLETRNRAFEQLNKYIKLLQEIIACADKVDEVNTRIAEAKSSQVDRAILLSSKVRHLLDGTDGCIMKYLWYDSFFKCLRPVVLYDCKKRLLVLLC
jgi:hypothetical protein